MFFFANYSYVNDSIPGRNQGNNTVPANGKHLQGDFSDLLRLPNPNQYIIYDPLTARPDPANPNRVIRTPFPNNVIPRDRIFNPDGTYKNKLFGLYAAAVPEAESELRRERTAADRQLLPWRRAEHPREPPVRLAPRLQRFDGRSPLLPRQRQQISRGRG